MQPQLKHLGLTQLEKALPALYETARQEQWTYESFMNRAIAAEIEGRDRRAAERRMTAARLPAIKTLEAFDFTFQPDLSERLLWELADLSFVQTATNVVFLGPPGTGKTHLSLALTVKALSAGYSALFTTLTHLAEALETAAYPSLVRQRLRRYTCGRNAIGDDVKGAHNAAPPHMWKELGQRRARGALHEAQRYNEHTAAERLRDRSGHHPVAPTRHLQLLGRAEPGQSGKWQAPRRRDGRSARARHRLSG